MVDNDGNLTAGGVFSIVALVLAPFILGLTLLKLFFRAPLAAVIGTIFCLALAWLGVLFGGAVTAEMNPIGALAVVGLLLCVGAGVCYALTFSGWMSRFFEWECEVLHFSLSRGGALGRVIYVFSQTLPGLVLAFMLGVFLLTPQPPMAQADIIIFLVLCGWLALSQFVVYRFHRTDHPVGKFATFTGRPRSDIGFEDSESA